MPRRLLLRLRTPAWVLWLALALPLMQAAAFGHALGHLAGHGAESTRKATPPGACESCLAGAALGSAAPATAQALPPPGLPQAGPPAAWRARTTSAAPRWHYRSRAPPASAH